MKYTKYDLAKYNIHLIQTKRFKTVTLQINFKRKIKLEDMTIRRLLTDVLFESSLKYPSRRLIEMETESLYGSSLRYQTYTSGMYDVMSFQTHFLNEKYTEKGMNKNSILFFLQFLTNPDIKNGEFSDYGFDLGQRVIKNDIKSFSDHPNSYSSKRMLEVLDKKSPLSYRNCGYLKDLKKITKKDLYEYYKDVLENDIIDISIIGDIKDDIVEIFKENFTRNNNNKISDSHYVEIKKKKIKEKIENFNLNQSKLVIGCSYDFEHELLPYILNIYSFILGGSGDSLLFKNVREKNSLCYSISSTYNLMSNLIVIRSGIDSKNYHKTVDLIKECMHKMSSGDFSIDEIKKAQTIYKNSCLEMMDSPVSIISNYISHEYLNLDLMEDRIKKIDLVTKDMIVSLAKKVEVNIIYMLKGDKNEKRV